MHAHLALGTLLAVGTARLAWHVWSLRSEGVFTGPDLHPPPEMFAPYEPASQRLTATVGYGMLAILGYVFAASVAKVVGQSVAERIDPGWIKDGQLVEPARTIVNYLAEDFGRLVGGVGTLLLMASFFARNSIRSIGWSLHRWGAGVLAGADAFVSVYPVCFALVLLTSLFVETPTHQVLEQLRSADTFTGVLLVFTAVVVAPIAEETLFRGWLQSGLRSFFETFVESPTPKQPIGHTARAAAIVLSSVCFAAVHVPYWHAMPALFALSVCLGLLFERRGTLVAPIALHLLFNAWNVAITMAGGDV